MNKLRSLGSRLVVSTAAAALSIFIHVLFVSALIGAGRSVQTHRHDALGANEVVTGEEPTSILFFFEDPAVASGPDEPLPPVASHGKVLQALRMSVVSPEVDISMPSVEHSDASEPEADATQDTSSDRQGVAALYGHYLSQIQARIERAWIRPRSGLAHEDFDCRIQIQQNERGEVGEVTLRTCGEDVPWQLSLIRAIEGASPLPAPPDPRVFTHAFELVFHAISLLPGASEAGYAPAPAQNASTP